MSQTKHVRIAGGVVIEEIPFSSAPIAERYPPEIAEAIRAAPAEVECGWMFDGAAFHAPPPPAISRSDLAAYAAATRWRVETGGIAVGGVPVAIDDRSKTMIMGARIKADADPEYSVGWKGADGSFVTLGAAQIIAISDAVLAHVDACFAAEATIQADIEAGEVSSMADIDAWPWP